MIGQVWTTTTQEMASRVLKDNHVFTLRKEDGAVAGMRWWMPSIFRVFAKNMLTVDEPDHSRLRGIVEEAFRRRAVLDMAPRIRAIAGQLADELFVQGSPADLVARYARKLPLWVICELLGLPLADRPKFMAWANRATSASSTLVLLRMVPTLIAIKRYREARLIASRRWFDELILRSRIAANIVKPPHALPSSLGEYHMTRTELSAVRAR